MGGMGGMVLCTRKQGITAKQKIGRQYLSVARVPQCGITDNVQVGHLQGSMYVCVYYGVVGIVYSDVR